MLTGASQATASEPCTKAQDTCTEWVALDANGSRGRIYRTHALSNTHEKSEIKWIARTDQSFLRKFTIVLSPDSFGTAETGR